MHTTDDPGELRSELSASEIRRFAGSFTTSVVRRLLLFVRRFKTRPAWAWRRLLRPWRPRQGGKPASRLGKNRGMRAAARAPWGLQGSDRGLESMAPFVSPTLTVVSAIVAVVSLLLYIHS